MRLWFKKRTVQLVYAFRCPDHTWFTDPAAEHMIPCTSYETEVCDPFECVRMVRYGTFPLSVRSHTAPMSIWTPYETHPQRQRTAMPWTSGAERQFFFTPPF